MPRHYADDDDDIDESVEGFQYDDDAETIPCPHCRMDVYEDAEQCPNCGQYFSSEDGPVAQKPWWIVIGAVTCLLIDLYWAFGH